MALRYVAPDFGFDLFVVARSASAQHRMSHE